MLFNAEPQVTVLRYRLLVTLEVDSTVEVTVDLTFKKAHNTDKYQDLKVALNVKVTTGETTSVSHDTTKFSTSEAAELHHEPACFERDFEHIAMLASNERVFLYAWV